MEGNDESEINEFFNQLIKYLVRIRIVSGLINLPGVNDNLWRVMNDEISGLFYHLIKYLLRIRIASDLINLVVERVRVNHLMKYLVIIRIIRPY